MPKIVINRCYGGFNVSDIVMRRLGLPTQTEQFPEWGTPNFNSLSNAELGIESENAFAYRADPRLIDVVEELGEGASGACAELGVVEVPDDVEWQIAEYDGLEHVEEAHRTWG